jgi:Fe-S oxidoreductase
MTEPISCALCPKLCRFVCPVAHGTADEGATPTAMMQSLLAAQSERLAWTEAAENLAKCTACGACAAPCAMDQDVPAMVRAGRAEAWAQGAIPDGARALHKNLLTTMSPFGEDPRETLRRHAAPDDFDRKGRVLFWPGCHALHDDAASVAATMGLLRALGAAHVSLPAREEVPCCGAPLRAIGDVPGFQVSVARLQQYFNRQRTWVSGSATCLVTVRDGFAAAGNAITAEVLHLAEYLLFFRDRLGDAGRLACLRAAARSEPLPRVVVFDSCQLHRHCGRGDAVYDAVATMTGTRPLGFAASPDRSNCCGAGDFFAQRAPEAAADVAAYAVRGRDLPVGAIVVTGDTACVASLSAALPKHRVRDVAGFANDWLGPVLSELPEPAPRSGLKAP